jgi:hypothetical protein
VFPLNAVRHLNADALGHVVADDSGSTDGAIYSANVRGPL